MCGGSATIPQGMAPSRDLLCRDEGFTPIRRYLTGRILSPKKTLQEIDDMQVWDAERPSRRALHAAVWEAQLDAEALMPRHRAGVAKEHGRQGCAVMSLDWTRAHHGWGSKIDGVTTR